MLLTSDSRLSGILPSEYNNLVIDPITQDALPFNAAVATTVRLSEGVHDFHVPVLRDDASAAWVAEGEEIAPSDPTLDEVTIGTSKVAGLTIVSREVAQDSSPQAQQIVGASLARALTIKINEAFIKNLATPAPKGLGSLTTATKVTGSLANLDVFAEAIAAVEQQGRNVTAFLASPADALTLAKIKVGDKQNSALLADPRIIQGRPVIVSKDLAAGTLYAVDSTTIYTVLHQDVEIAFSSDAFFTSDRVAIRGVARVGYGFPAPENVTRITLA